MGNKTFTPGLVRGNVWYLNDGFDGTAERAFTFGRSTDTFVVGDWDGNATYTPGIVRENLWYLNDGFDGSAEASFRYGDPGDVKIVGVWPST